MQARAEEGPLPRYLETLFLFPSQSTSSPPRAGCHQQGGLPPSAHCAPPVWSPGTTEPCLDKPHLLPARKSHSYEQRDKGAGKHNT